MLGEVTNFFVGKGKKKKKSGTFGLCLPHSVAAMSYHIGDPFTDFPISSIRAFLDSHCSSVFALLQTICCDAGITQYGAF
jgi:hypothetical protein